MNKTRLLFKTVSEIVGTDDIGLLVMVDAAQTRQLAITCDKHMLHQFGLRLGNVPILGSLLPEVLWTMIRNLNADRYEILIVDVNDGQYRTLLYDIDTREPVSLRASDAILLSLIAHLPVYIDTALFERQSVPYKPDSPALALPVNTITDNMLKAALDKAVADENYELASHLHEEMMRRKNSHKEREEGAEE
jgi:bifunctional DNase/RNase